MNATISKTIRFFTRCRPAALPAGRHRVLPFGILPAVALGAFCSVAAAASLPVSANEAAERLAARLKQRDSATAVLQEYCPVPIRVARLRGHDQPPSAEILSLLKLSSAQEVSVRHVRLLCRATVLSDAWNWYVPARLTPDANQLLTKTDTPFGRAVGEASFRRAPLASQIFAPSSPVVLENRALLSRRSDGAPIAFVIETYTAAALSAPVRTEPAPN